jgi:hypothetical protein
MSYLHIDNLYKNQDILLFKECYALEKIHGTSANVKWTGNAVTLFAGGADHVSFEKLFDRDALTAVFAECLGNQPITVYGEAYGGKIQGMSKTYGEELKFVIFEVRDSNGWWCVPGAEDMCKRMGLEYVYYRRIPTTLEEIDGERDAPSVQAVRNGIVGEPKMREGIVLRPLIEVTKNNGERIIAKHKRAEFAETKTPRSVDPAQRMEYENAQAFAREWVTPMRLIHILDAFPGANIEQTGEVIRAVFNDVVREAGEEFMNTKDNRKAVGAEAARLFRRSLQEKLYE